MCEKDNNKQCDPDAEKRSRGLRRPVLLLIDTEIKGKEKADITE